MLGLGFCPMDLSMVPIAASTTSSVSVGICVAFDWRSDAI